MIMNKETKWTPGPWKPVWNGYFFDINPEGNLHSLASVNSAWDESCGPGTQEANAHLIAAAPDLYAELEDARCMIQALIDEGYSGYVEQRERIDRILAKARGETE